MRMISYTQHQSNALSAKLLSTYKVAPIHGETLISSPLPHKVSREQYCTLVRCSNRDERLLCDLREVGVSGFAQLGHFIGTLHLYLERRIFVRTEVVVTHL
jgi:hypothetical protein